MKKLIVLFTIIICGCDGKRNSQTGQSECITFLYDCTDTHHLVRTLSVGQLKAHLQLRNNHQASGAVITLKPITDLRLNKSHTISIPPVSDSVYNELHRDDDIDTFWKRVDMAIESVKHEKTGYK
jgi:hypothetical protein